jgi:hypothetical protein
MTRTQLSQFASRAVACAVLAVSVAYLGMEWILDPLEEGGAYVDDSAYGNVTVRILFRYSVVIVGCAAWCSSLMRPRWPLERLALCTAGALAGIAVAGIALLSDQAISVLNTDKNPFGEILELGIDVGVRPAGGFGGLALWLACMIAVVVVRLTHPSQGSSPSLPDNLTQPG